MVVDGGGGGRRGKAGVKKGEVSHATLKKHAASPLSLALLSLAG